MSGKGKEQDIFFLPALQTRLALLQPENRSRSCKTSLVARGREGWQLTMLDRRLAFPKRRLLGKLQ